MVVDDQGALWGWPVCQFARSRRPGSQQPLGHPDIDAGQGAAAVPFQSELVFEGVEGALDPPADAAQRAVPAGLIGPVGA
jgi:hypothetical protein